MIKLQVTLFSTTGMYKPMSTIVKIESMEYYKANKKEVQQKAIENICRTRYTSWNKLKQDGFTQVKVREYDKEKIKQQEQITMLKKIMNKREKEKKETSNK